MNECARCGRVLVGEDDQGWYYQVPVTDDRAPGFTFMDRQYQCDGKPHVMRQRREARRPRRPLAVGWYVAGGCWIFAAGLVGTLYTAFACYGLSVSAWWWSGKCALAALVCWNAATLTLRWLLKDMLRRSKKQSGRPPDTLDPSQVSEINWP